MLYYIDMKITAMNIVLNAPWVSSLKQKRSEVKKLIAGVQNKFRVSCIESGSNDDHKTIELGISYASSNDAGADKMQEFILNYIESNSQAALVDIESEKWNW